MASANLRLERPTPTGGRVWPGWIFKTLLAVLFCGPLVAPLFQATGLPLLADSGALARALLASYVCPTPAKSYVLLGFPMAVCARCWGATVGLWVGWALFTLVTNDRRAAAGDAGPRTKGTGRKLRHSSALPLQRFLALPWGARLGLAALPFLAWVAEIVWWPGAPYTALLLNGAQAGLAAGLFFCSIWPGLGSVRPAGG